MKQPTMREGRSSLLPTVVGLAIGNYVGYLRQLLHQVMLQPLKLIFVHQQHLMIYHILLQLLRSRECPRSQWVQVIWEQLKVPPHRMHSWMKRAKPSLVTLRTTGKNCQKFKINKIIKAPLNILNELLSRSGISLTQRRHELSFPPFHKIISVSHKHHKAEHQLKSYRLQRTLICEHGAPRLIFRIY